MRAVIKTCEHCGREYTYYASGEYCLHITNDEHLCSTCKRAVIDALTKIPVEFWKRNIDCDGDFTEEEIHEIISKGKENYSQI